jgi:NTE family protein
MDLGIALAGGGLKGIAYIGVLKALEELGVKPKYLSATSSGSMFASFYAMGYSPEEMKPMTEQYYKMLTALDKKPIIKAGVTYATSGVARIEGIIPGERISNLIEELAKEKNIKNMNDLDINYAVCTVDTISTNECIFLSKPCDKKDEYVDYIYDAPISTATRASMSFPAIFTPCNYGKYNFIDGGTKDNLPVKILKNMGADKTLAINFRIDDYEPREDIFAILLRAVDIFSLEDVRNAQKIADLSIEVDASGTGLLVIDDFDKLIQIGYDTIMQNKEKILNLL